MSKHTPGPWEIYWYECRSNIEDVEAGTAKKVGDVLWQVPKQIGPIVIGENHWARNYLDVSEEDARLIAAAPETAAERDRLKEINAELLHAIETLLGETDDSDYMLQTERESVARAAIYKAKDRTEQK